VEALRKVPGIDPSRVFVLGHSQGAMMAPRIAAHAAQAGAPVAGIVLMAAPSRKLLDILIEQQRRLAVLDDGHTSEQEAAAIANLERQVALVRAGGDVAPEDSPLKQPATYWRSTDAVDPVAEAKADALPMLVLQGTRDIQVVDADWQRWKGAFHDDPAVTFKLYDGLSHLGIKVEGDDDMAAYSVPGHVDAQLIADVAAWIGAH
jgi:poly(3-hydroxybutyrate) depolymerase